MELICKEDEINTNELRRKLDELDEADEIRNVKEQSVKNGFPINLLMRLKLLKIFQNFIL